MGSTHYMHKDVRSGQAQPWGLKAVCQHCHIQPSTCILLISPAGLRNVSTDHTSTSSKAAQDRTEQDSSACPAADKLAIIPKLTTQKWKKKKKNNCRMFPTGHWNINCHHNHHPPAPSHLAPGLSAKGVDRCVWVLPYLALLRFALPRLPCPFYLCILVRTYLCSISASVWIGMRKT